MPSRIGSLAKADNSVNDTIIVDPYGRIIASAVTPGGDRSGQVAVADAPLGMGDPLTVRLGDGKGWIALEGMVFFIIYDPVAKVRTKRIIRPIGLYGCSACPSNTDGTRGEKWQRADHQWWQAGSHH